MKRFLFVALFAIARTMPAQELSDPVVLIVETENAVQYRGDTSDITKLVTVPGPTMGVARTFLGNVTFADIVAVNGKPAKGLWNNNFVQTPLRVSPALGQPIADFDGNGHVQCFWNFLLQDGTFVGSLADRGQEPAAGGAGHIVIGGNGAFFGAIGEHRLEQAIAPMRAASTSEDPSMRRINGGGKIRLRFTLYPRFRPSVQMTANRPAIFHGDYSPVTTANPARPGELLILGATGLGPVRPDLLPPGAVEFSAAPFQEVNSPVTVVFNGKELPVIDKIGWPGQRNLYWLDFRVPSDAGSGTATLQLIAAWIPGPVVTIPVSARQ